MTHLCECGCGQPTRLAPKTRTRDGVVKGQPLRFINGHHNRRPRDTWLGLDRWREEDGGYVTPCYIWTGATNQAGYGTVRERETNRTRDAHRLIWERERGPLPAGLELDHLCRVRACVRLDHLEPVTHRENMRRSPITKLTPETAQQIREAQGTQAVIATRFGVSRTLVSFVRQGRAWPTGEN
jgi:hypothetical protein